MVIPAPALELGVQFLGGPEAKVGQLGGVHVGGSLDAAVQAYTVGMPKKAICVGHHDAMSWA